MEIPKDVLDKLYFPNIKEGDKVIDMNDIKGSLDNHELTKCDFLLINNEGYEMALVFGAHETITKFKPKILIAFNSELELVSINDVIQALMLLDLKYDYIVNIDHHIDSKYIYLYAWINNGQRISPQPTLKRIIGYKDIGELAPNEVHGRNIIRARKILPSDGPDPDIYTMQFMPGHKLKFKAGKVDAWNSWREFASEINVRTKFWYPNIKPGDVVVDAGAAWGSYAITAGLLGATAYAYEPHPAFCKEMAENVQLNGLNDKVHIFEAGLSDREHYMDWDELKNIRLVALDEHAGGRRIDFIKIDVEGQELEVLKGARQTIAKYKPKIMMEAHLIYNKKMIPDAAEYIMKLADGYELVVYDCIPSGDTIYTYFHNTSK